MLPLVSEQRRRQALRYKHVFGQYCCLRSWMMVREGVNELMSEGVSELMSEWQYNEYGKPSFIPSLFHSLTPYFSISHCKAGIAVAVADEPIGIDIETIRHADEDLIERTMNEQERLAISDERLEERDRLFTRLWTQKEAVLKAIGTGIQSFEQVQTILENGDWRLETIETEKYIYSIAYGKLHCLGA